MGQTSTLRGLPRIRQNFEAAIFVLTPAVPILQNGSLHFFLFYELLMNSSKTISGEYNFIFSALKDSA